MSQSATALVAPSKLSERRRNLGLFGVSAAHAVNHMSTALLPLIYPVPLIEFHFNYVVLGIIIAVSNVSGLLQAAFGYINRRISARTLIGWKTIALGVCVALMAVTGNIVQFAAAGGVGSEPG